MRVQIVLASTVLDVEREDGNKDLAVVLDWRDAVLAVAVGVSIALALGFVENTPQVYIGPTRLYGYPIAWRIVPLFSPASYNTSFLFLDIALWITVAFTVVAILEGISQKLEKRAKEQT